MKATLYIFLGALAVTSSIWITRPATADDVRAFRFSRGEFLTRATLGPGGARGMSIQLGLGPPVPLAQTDDLVIAIVTSNPPGCGEPTISTDGDLVSCQWVTDCLDPFEAVEMCFQTTKGPISVVTAYFVDEFSTKIAPAMVEEIPATCGPVNCSGAQAAAPVIWPPNHAMVPVTIEGLVGQGPFMIEATQVTSDEAVNNRGDGNTCPDAQIINGVAHVRRERAGGGNGRVYRVSFTATDATGNQCQGSVDVCVPAHQGAGATCVDDGQTFDPLAPCARRASRTESDGIQPFEVIAFPVRGGMATVELGLPIDTTVRLSLYDITGRRVATLVDGHREAGRHHITWDPGRLPRGLYYYRLQVAESSTSKMVLIAR